MGRLFAGLTDRGVVRPVNQDSYYVDPQGRFFIVADGMGGHAGGQEASRLATEIIQSHLEKYWQSSIASEQLLEESFVQANNAILADQEANPERSEMGTTAVVVAFR
ncbi:MAG: protein phosphatase 2C domain-containing protein, partial [Cyanobacteria bacterium J06641_5]